LLAGHCQLAIKLPSGLSGNTIVAAHREIVPNERIVSTQVYEAAPDAPGLATTTFSEVDGRTTLAILVAHTSRENRDAHLNSGMQDGANESLDLLEQVALSLQ
jgi:uncharacterized protein YndB with AHSA1/START domain